MSRVAEYILSWSEEQHLYKLCRSSTQELLSILPDSPEWFTWLSAVSSFAFHGKQYSLTVRRERTQRGKTYWYGYSRIRKQVRKKYLGKDVDLFAERLEQVATLLHAEHLGGAASDDPHSALDRASEPVLAVRSHKAPPQKEKKAFPDPLLSTKLCIPCLPVHLILRPRLFAQLQRALSYPLTLISASAGSGKTTLLSSWVRSSSFHALWVCLEGEDDEPLRFWSYFFAALNAALFGVADLALALLRLQASPPLEILLTLVINNLVECSTPIVIVLDDYHVIANPAIHQGLIFLLDHQPSTLHLILVARADPPFPLERLRMRAQLLELRNQALYFTRDEASDFLALTTGLTFSDEDLAFLHTRTEGWIAALQLFTISFQGKAEGVPLPQGLTGGHRFIFDYLLAEALRRRLEQTQPSLLPMLYQRAIDWCEQAGQYHEAVTYALVLKDFERVARILELVGLRMVERGEVTVVQRWVKELPRELICSRLRLCLFEGWRLVLNNQFAETQQLLQEYEQHQQRTAVSVPEEPWELLGEQLGLRSTLAMRGQGDLPLAIQLARQALVYYPPASMGRALLLFNLGTISWLTGDQQASIEALSESIKVSQAAGSDYSAALAAHVLCSLLLQRGELRRVDRLLQQLLAPHSEKQIPRNGSLLICLGTLLCEWNRPDEAIRSLRQGIVQCQQFAQFVIQISGYVALARLYLGQEKSVLAREALREAEPFLMIPDLPERWTLQIKALYAWCDCIQGHETAMKRWLQSCTFTIHDTFDPQRISEYLIWARLLRLQRRLAEARTILAYLLRYTEDQEYTGRVIEILVQLALVDQEQRNSIEARERLMSALALAEPENYLRVFLDESPALIPLLVHVREAHMQGLFPSGQSCSLHYLDTLLTHLPMQEQNAQAEKAASDLLSSREMEVLQLLASGCSNREIARRLVIALSTVKSHVNTIYNKLNVESRTQAVARARECQLIFPQTTVPPSAHP